VTAAELVDQLLALGPAIDLDLAEQRDLTSGQLGWLLLALRFLIRSLQDDYRDTEAALARQLRETGAESLALPGAGIFTLHRKVKRTRWQIGELTRAIAARISDEPATFYDTDTGEQLPHAQVVANVVARVRATCAISAGKVTGMREIGLQVDEFCDVDMQGYVVQLPELGDGWTKGDT